MPVSIFCPILIILHYDLLAKDKIGTVLPYNVILKEKEGGFIEEAVDPMATMQAAINQGQMGIANDVSEKLKRVIDNIHHNH